MEPASKEKLAIGIFLGLCVVWLILVGPVLNSYADAADPRYVTGDGSDELSCSNTTSGSLAPFLETCEAGEPDCTTVFYEDDDEGADVCADLKEDEAVDDVTLCLDGLTGTDAEDIIETYVCFAADGENFTTTQVLRVSSLHDSGSKAGLLILEILTFFVFASAVGVAFVISKNGGSAFCNAAGDGPAQKTADSA